MPRISIVILTFNSASYISRCLQSIAEHYSHSIEEGKMEIIIVDNSSTDKTVNSLKKFIVENGTLKNTVIVENSGNTGFAKGVNIGVKKAKGEHILLINPDSQVLDGNILQMDELIKDKVVIVGGKMIGSDEKSEFSAGKFYTPFNLLFFSLGIEESMGVRSSPRNIQEVDFISGGFMLIDKKFFIESGGFDPQFFMYMEDMDLCFRAKKRGCKILFYPYAKIKHYGQRSSNREFAIENIYRGIYLFSKKHNSGVQQALVKKMLKSKAVGGIITGKVLKNKSLESTYRKALKIHV